MIVVPSISVDNDNLVSSTIPAIDTDRGEVLWVSGTYTLGQQVVYDDGVYACLTPGSRTINPKDDPNNWVYIGVSNRFAMFDLFRNTRTISADEIVAEIQLNQRINTVVFAGLAATSVRVEMIVGLDVVFDSLTNLQVRNTLSWSDYFFGAFESKKSTIVQGLPIYSNAILRITITNDNGAVECGAIVFNNHVFIGDVKYGAEADSLNFSRIERDEFGKATLRPRRALPKTKQTISVKASHVDKIRAVRSMLDAVPAAWVGLEKTSSSDYFDMFVIIGIWTKFTINANMYEDAEIQLDLEEI